METCTKNLELLERFYQSFHKDPYQEFQEFSDWKETGVYTGIKQPFCYETWLAGKLQVLFLCILWNTKTSKNS